MIKVIFTMYIFSRIFVKRHNCENIYSVKITFSPTEGKPTFGARVRHDHPMCAFRVTNANMLVFKKPRGPNVNHRGPNADTNQPIWSHWVRVEPFL